MAVRLVAFDLDGTLIRGESCIQAIARSIGRSTEIATFEQFSMRDVIQVTAAREEMARWFRSLTEEELVAGLADLRLAPRAEDAFSILRSHGVRTAIISITWRSAVQVFARRLGADHAFGTRITPTAIEHVWPPDKGRLLETLATDLELGVHEVAAVGDSENDRELLSAAGMRFCVGTDPLEVPNLIHLPSGDMLEIAEMILDLRG